MSRYKEFYFVSRKKGGAWHIIEKAQLKKFGSSYVGRPLCGKFFSMRKVLTKLSPGASLCPVCKGVAQRVQDIEKKSRTFDKKIMEI